MLPGRNTLLEFHNRNVFIIREFLRSHLTVYAHKVTTVSPLKAIGGGCQAKKTNIVITGWDSEAAQDLAKGGRLNTEIMSWPVT